jgi:chorismate mutase
MPQSTQFIASALANADQAPPDPDGSPAATPSGGLPALRAELDRIDNAIHDLLMQRARVVEEVGRSGKPAAFRPGREASIIRRLLAQHHGKLPAMTLCRLWRELLAGTTAMQGAFVISVGPGEAGDGLAQLAREHFGALTPLRIQGSAGQALNEVQNGHAAVAVVPMPSEAETWWSTLMRPDRRLYVVARLPFWATRPDGAPALQALVVASTPPDPSGDDRSFVAFEADGDVGRARIASELAAAGLTPETIVLARAPGGSDAHVLVEVSGAVAEDDARLAATRPLLRHAVVVGGYAVPVGGGA